MYTLDTNAVIYYLNNDKITVPILRDILKKDVPIYISTVSEVELFGYPNLSVTEEREISNILSSLATIPLDSRIAGIAGFIRRTYNLKIADSIIAATALFTGSVLLTRNVKDFQKVKELNVMKV